MVFAQIFQIDFLLTSFMNLGFIIYRCACDATQALNSLTLIYKVLERIIGKVHGLSN